MGYDTRLIVVDRCEHLCESTKVLWVYGDEIARFEMCGMADANVDGKTFFELFDTPIDFNLNIHVDESGEYDEEAYRKDCYGKHCGYVKLDRLIDWLYKSGSVMEYRRAKYLLLALTALKANEKDWEELVVVHYGH